MVVHFVLSRVVRALRADESGTIVIWFAMMLSVLFGFGALAVDVGHLYTLQTRLQGAADAAALAALAELPDEDAARTKALEYAGKNLSVDDHGVVLKTDGVEFGQWDSGTRTFVPDAEPADAIRIIVRRAQANGNAAPTFFARVLGYGQVDVDASSIARPASAPICILALDPDADASFDVGNGTVTANGCAVHVNSDSPTGLTGGPNGTIAAEEICVVGSYRTKPDYSDPLESGCPPVPDPLASLAPPSYTGCDENNFKITKGDATLDPGVYCGGIDIKGNGTVTLNPGIYIIKDGSLDLAGNAQLIGDGVSIYVTGAGADVDVTGGGAITLSAPTTGSMAGILFFGDRALASGTSHAFKGGGNIHYEGTIYFPTTDVWFAGNGAGASPSPYSMFIARQFRFNGNGELSVNYNYEASDVPLAAQMHARSAGLVM